MFVNTPLHHMLDSEKYLRMLPLPLLEDLVKEKNGLLLWCDGFGKTYTLTEEPPMPGVMPRCIKAEEATFFGQEVICNLVFDELSIRKHIEWTGKKFTGCVDFDADTLPKAKEVLLFMLVYVNGSWKIPVGYYLLNGFCATGKASLWCRGTGVRPASKKSGRDESMRMTVDDIEDIGSVLIVKCPIQRRIFNELLQL
ncbi:hypothetical protein ILUMI_25468 [Ignelater luminosus]|uniref:Transposable element P transposase-like RNase H domain-containing protein n=1 Tax=Ignelater luminosus TaxID=2038154 RepID=A0A8K0FZX3_IGNLU|nr:hypothetical protein ILUMI_25468 [Ignelater luminosus]